MMNSSCNAYDKDGQTDFWGMLHDIANNFTTLINFKEY